MPPLPDSGGGRHLSDDSEMRQEGLDLGRAERRRMTLAVEQHVASNPVGVGLLGADAVVLEPDLRADWTSSGWADRGSKVSAGVRIPNPGRAA